MLKHICIQISLIFGGYMQTWGNEIIHARAEALLLCRANVNVVLKLGRCFLQLFEVYGVIVGRTCAQPLDLIGVEINVLKQVKPTICLNDQVGIMSLPPIKRSSL